MIRAYLMSVNTEYYSYRIKKKVSSVKNALSHDPLAPDAPSVLHANAMSSLSSLHSSGRICGTWILFPVSSVFLPTTTRADADEVSI